MVTHSSDNLDHGEYGGGRGAPDRKPGRVAKGLTPGESARIMRQMGGRGDFNRDAPDNTVGTGSATARDEIDADRRAAELHATEYNRSTRAELREKTNGYSDEDFLQENGSA